MQGIGRLFSPERPGCPSLRASSEHSLIVRVLRALRVVWLLPSRQNHALSSLFHQQFSGCLTVAGCGKIISAQQNVDGPQV
ncbi:MAG: hypothetical protein EWM73_01411 [Nitrospira sp.]|nr:MAG: hypothetical protein EWM73_01411 [Nitrospira sp.]